MDDAGLGDGNGAIICKMTLSLGNRYWDRQNKNWQLPNSRLKQRLPKHYVTKAQKRKRS